jgi:phosphatidylserine decarboxylase
VVKEVWPYLTSGVALTAILALAGLPIAAMVSGALTVAVAAFFRDPRRNVPVDTRLILSPADGRIVAIAPPADDSSPTIVSIFLSVFNVHVNRAPVAGRVTHIRYTPGSFLPAFRDKASELNEQNLIHMETVHGPLAVKQIAGLIARRIRCWKKAGDTVSQGEKIGFITFGSRVDLYLPRGTELRVRLGDRVRGGTSVVAVYPQEGA